MGADAARVVAIVPTVGSVERLERCLHSVTAQTLPFARVLAVRDDAARNPPSASPLPGAVQRLDLPRRFGFAGTANAGIREALEDSGVTAVALINDDVRLDQNWNEAAVAAMSQQADIGSCATVVVQARNPRRVDSAGIDWCIGALADNRGHGSVPPSINAPVEEVWGASASAALYRRSLFSCVGLFEESFTSYQEDVDLALRAHLHGWRCVLAPGARSEHDGFASNRYFPAGGTWADFYNARNRLTLLLTTLPAGDWRRHWPSILSRHSLAVLRSVREGRMAPVWLGAAHALWRLPSSLHRRKRLKDALDRQRASGP